MKVSKSDKAIKPRSGFEPDEMRRRLQPVVHEELSMSKAPTRFRFEVLELTQDCELGRMGERAVVVHLDDRYMTLLFPNRHATTERSVKTGADYRFVRSV